MAKGLLAPRCLPVWKSQKVMRTFATTLFSMFCLGHRDRYPRKFSAVSAIDCKSVFDHMTKPGDPTRLDDKKASRGIVMAKGGLRTLGTSLRWSPAELMLGDAPLRIERRLRMICEFV